MKSFKEFWPFYLSEHSKRSTKVVHFVGTSIGFCFLIPIFYTGNLWIVPVALLTVYAPLFLSHFIFEKNKPATLKHPLWSAMADIKMWFFILTGKIKL